MSMPRLIVGLPSLSDRLNGHIGILTCVNIVSLLFSVMAWHVKGDKGSAKLASGKVTQAITHSCLIAS